MKTNVMMIFECPMVGKLRVVKDEDGKPWFFLADVCKTLNLNLNNEGGQLDGDEITTDTITDENGKKRHVDLVNEEGLLDVLFDRRKFFTKGYREWILDVVLPQVRNWK